MLAVETRGAFIDASLPSYLENPEYLLDGASQYVAEQVFDAPPLRTAHVLDGHVFSTRMVLAVGADAIASEHCIQAARDAYHAALAEEAAGIVIDTLTIATLVDPFPMYSDLLPTGKLEVTATCALGFSPELVLHEIEGAMLAAFARLLGRHHYFHALAIVMTDGVDVILFTHFYDQMPWDVMMMLDQLAQDIGTQLPANFATIEVQLLG